MNGCNWHQWNLENRRVSASKGCRKLIMSERDYAPLSTACVRALNDKLYEKRKAAALEIEKWVCVNSDMSWLLFTSHFSISELRMRLTMSPVTYIWLSLHITCLNLKHYENMTVSLVLKWSVPKHLRKKRNILWLTIECYRKFNFLT